MNVASPTPSFWLGRRVLVTGHSGFKGSWLVLALHRLGAQVTGLSLPPSTTPSLFELARVGQLCSSHFCDLRDRAHLTRVIHAADPEITLHLAAQPLVRASYSDPVGTFSTNVMGTVHVLDALRGLQGQRVAVMITTDKVYENREWLWPYRECDSLGGHDPYSASKAACEIAIASYRDAFLAKQGVAVASARAGNVIGGGDWSEDRLVPDAVRAWSAGQALEIRNPAAVRPWQHVIEPLASYLVLAEALWSKPGHDGAFNFGPPTGQVASVRNVIDLARESFGAGEVVYGTEKGPHEAGRLSLDTSKAREVLGVTSRWDLRASITHTMNWYQKQLAGSDARELCIADMEAWGIA